VALDGLEIAPEIAQLLENFLVVGWNLIVQFAAVERRCINSYLGVV
jgi:hypothetical protein